MSQTGYTPIQLYYSTTAATAPTAGNLVSGELAINITDGKLFYKDNAGVVQTLATKATALSTVTNNGVVYVNSSGQATTGSALTFDGTTLTAAASGAAFATGSGTNGSYKLGYNANANSRSWKIINDLNTYGDFVVQQSTTQTGTTYRDIYNSLNDGTQFWSVAGSEQMRLTSTGLGIGTTSPAYKLSVVNASGVTVGLDKATGASLQFNASGVSDAQIAGNAAGSLLFYTGSSLSEKMRLDSSGNLGIGTSSPSFKLDVAASTSGQAIRYTGNSVSIVMGESGSAGFLGTTTTHNLNLVTSATVRATLDTSGNLGLGVTPSAWGGVFTSALQVRGAALVSQSNANITHLTQNVYYNSSNNPIYIATDYATKYTQYQGQHQWFNVASGTGGTAISAFTQAMTLDASGNLGIGLTSISGNATNRVVSAQGSDSANFVVTRTGNESGALYAFSGSIYAGSNTNHPFAFVTNATERARIDTSGNLLVGTTSTSFNGQITSQVANTKYSFASNQTGATNFYHHVFYQNGTQVGSITSTTSLTSYNVTSDQRLKENVVDAPEFGDVIDSIQVRSFDWKADQTHQRAGFIAQELVTVAPEAVHQPADPEEMMAVDYSKLVPMLVKEIQSLRKRLADAGI